METNETTDGAGTLALVRAYFRAWTHRDFDAAIGRLADGLEVEVPINAYPTKASFAEALTAFGGMINGVVLLAELADRDQAMLLYEKMLKPADIRRPRRQFHRRAVRHHSVQSLFRFVHGFLFFAYLFLDSKCTLKEKFHLTDGVAANDGDLRPLTFKILQRPWLSLFMSLQCQYDIPSCRCACNRNLNMQVICSTK